MSSTGSQPDRPALEPVTTRCRVLNLDGLKVPELSVPEKLNAAGANAHLARELAFEAFKHLRSDLVPFELRDRAAKVTTDLDELMAEMALFQSGLMQGGHR